MIKNILKYLQQLKYETEISVVAINDKVTGISSTYVFFWSVFLIEGNYKDQVKVINIKM